MTKQVVSILQKEGVLQKEALPRLREFERLRQGNVLDFVVHDQRQDAARVFPLLRDGYRVQVINLPETSVNIDSVSLLPKELCIEHGIVAFNHTDDHVWVAMSDPDNADVRKFIEQRLDKELVPYLADRTSILRALEQVGTSIDSQERAIQALIEQARQSGLTSEVMAKETPIIELLNRLIRFGLDRKSSDMHIEPAVDSVMVRYRIDGLLHEIFRLPRELLAPVVARIKILSRMRIDEHLRPQDGRFSFADGSLNVAVRVSIVPTLYGSKAALRFLDTGTSNLQLEAIGLSNKHIEKLQTVLSAPHGLILVTGPTGSGKTTTLYGMMNALHKSSLNISTIEDPIEYHVPGVNQIQVNGQVGLDFSEGLRSILRQDPDIILVGEIRDKETAQIAINAALTGHLVLSSLHTNSAAGAIPRLIDMGIEPYLIASTLRAVVGQRLVRTVCTVCGQQKTTNEVPEILAAPLRKHPKVAAEHALTYTEGAGCDQCLGTGFAGRTGLFELLVLDQGLHETIMNRPNSRTIEDAAATRGMITIAEDAASKVLSHNTTPSEVARVLATS